MDATLHFAPELLLRAKRVKVVFFDVDGVLTDGGLLYSETGETLKRFEEQKEQQRIPQELQQTKQLVENNRKRSITGNDAFD